MFYINKNIKKKKAYKERGREERQIRSLGLTI